MIFVQTLCGKSLELRRAKKTTTANDLRSPLHCMSKAVVLKRRRETNLSKSSWRYLRVLRFVQRKSTVALYGHSDEQLCSEWTHCECLPLKVDGVSVIAYHGLDHISQDRIRLSTAQISCHLLDLWLVGPSLLCTMTVTRLVYLYQFIRVI